MCICVCMRVFVSVCLCLCVPVCMVHVCAHAHVSICECVCGICMSSCAYVYMDVCVPAFVYMVYACAFIYVCMWKPEANNGCLCQSLSTLYLRSGSLFLSLSCLANELEESACLSSTSPRLGIDIRCYIWFYVGAGSQVFTWTLC